MKFFQKEKYLNSLSSCLESFTEKNANISQEKLSEILDVNSKFIGHVERVERFISLKKLIEIAEYFNVPVKNFFE